MKVIYVGDRGEEHEFLINDSRIAGVDFYADEDGKMVKFFLVSGKTMTLYLGFANDEPWKQLKDYYSERFINANNYKEELS